MKLRRTDRIPLRSPAELQRACDEFNDKTPVGTPVRFRERLDVLTGLETKTKSAAWVMGGHSAVVLLEDKSGCVAIDHVERMAPRQVMRAVEPRPELLEDIATQLERGEVVMPITWLEAKAVSYDELLATKRRLALILRGYLSLSPMQRLSFITQGVFAPHIPAAPAESEHKT